MPSSNADSETEPIFNWSLSEKRSGTAHRCLIFLVILLFIASAVFLTLFLVYFFKYEDRDKAPAVSNQKADKMEVCDTMDCLKTASLLVEKMDRSVDPCEDFAEYACGTFLKTVKMDVGETRKNSFTILNDENNEILKSILGEETMPDDPDYVTNVKNLYQSCMDEAKIEDIGLKPFLDTPYAKEWPTLIGQNWTGEAAFDLNNVIIRYMAISVEPIFSYGVSTDIMNPLRNTIWITAPMEERRDYFKLYNPTTLAALGQNYSYMDIPGALRAGFSIANMTLSDEQEITVLFPAFFEKLESVLANADKRALMNLFGFKTALSRVGGLTKKLRQISLEWAKRPCAPTTITYDVTTPISCVGFPAEDWLTGPVELISHLGFPPLWASSSYAGL
ncbi:membrane metallo-endopeptidase-like 1 [Elysia marginata]|uniref:Membrane metallo-endopeptidase-like 1 n=1 Tax=Elysia marginata TaxID=1093978 RepID=A0AAV4EXN6_9GAST|nr:membrane metallo-endopeptidase-like 1 [Elysia marginata]